MAGRQMSKFSRDYKINLIDIKSDFIATPEAVLRYFQECFGELCYEHDITGYILRGKGLMWVISNINLELVDTLVRWNERMRIEIWFSEVKKLRAYLEYRAYDGDRLVAQGDSCWFVLDIKTRKPVDIRPIVEVCGKDEEGVFLSHKGKNVQIKEENLVKEDASVISLNDIDYNNHVNNIAYVSWAIAALPEKVLAESKLRMLNIEYHRECFINDRIKLALYHDGSSYQLVAENDAGELLSKVNMDF